MAEQTMDWQSEPFRTKVVAQIEDAVRSSTSPMTKSSIEMENHVFQKAKTREEYLALVARLILHVKEMNANKDKPKGPGGMGMAQGMPPGAAGMSQPMPDPIGALQNLTAQGIGPVGQQGMMNQQQVHLQQQRLLLHQQQQQQRQMQMQRPQLERQDAFLVTSAQHVQSMAQPLPANSVGMTYQQAMPGGGMQQPGMQQGGMQQGGMQQGGGMQQPGMQQGGMQQGGMQQPGMQQTDMRQPGMQMTSMGMQHGMQQQRAQATTMGGISQASLSQASQLPYTQQVQPGSVLSSQQAVHSPKPPQSISSMMMSPSPQGMVNNPRVPSPRVLNTPGGPNSPSPNTPRSHEEQAYLDKLRQLQKYIEPLKRMINRLTTGKDEESKKDISKMENLLKILTDPSRRLPMATLLKCEQVLDSLEMSSSKTSGIGSVPSATPTITTTPMHMCQPLLDAVATNMKSPMFNHALQQTFGPAMTALFGAPIRAPSPPPKKRKREEEEEEIPHILQGEIACLGGRFRVNLDPTQHSHSKDIHLVCKIDDKNLPCVPPISVKVPELYPDVSPQCDSMAQEYESSPFLSSIQESLSRLLLHMPSKFTFTELMDKWEMSIRRACAAPS
ncbi:mediator of RNA polymerase II transcription subunit 15-like isoform X2 [Ostrea edulis]|uniref:mediator of RNA polymerase II transcription subunit 15-like isoform X2 n=1 Tax=Ostrea edulis TaxID=37623 RepID=UPI0024AFA730|nr:mediator of RNA polymerase II transcription subunit 15-like isoform X2 [Ostrea edulis]